MPRTRRILVATLVAAATMGRFGIPAEARAGTGEARQAIRDGTATDSDGAVVELRTDGTGPCTGTLVAPRVVLTAGHCVSPWAPDEASFGTGADDSPTVEVVGVAAHPLFDSQQLDHDLALAFLASPALAEPLPLSPAALGPDLVGERVRLVGFGKREPEDGGAPLKRTGFAEVGSLAERSLSLEPSPAAPCFGDSGGPVLLRDGDGREGVIGVLSAGDLACASGGVAMRIDAWPELVALLSFGDATGAGGCAMTASGRAGPSLPWALAVALAFVARRRRGGARHG